MVTMNSKEANKELNKRSGAILIESERVKRNAEGLLQALKQQEMQFARQEEESKLREKQVQQQEMLKQQVKAWTMPDDDATQKHEASEKPAVKAEASGAVPAQEGAPEKPAAAPTAAPAQAPADKPRQATEPAAPVMPRKPTATYAQPQQGQQQRGNFPPRPAGTPAPGGYQQRPLVGQRVGSPRPQTGAPGTAPRPPFQGNNQGRPPFAGQQNARPPFQGTRPPRPGGGVPFKNEDTPRVGNGHPSSRPRPKTDDVLVPIEKERVSNYDPNKKNYVRSYDPEHVSKNKRQMTRGKDNFATDDDDSRRSGKRLRPKKLSAQQMMAPIKIDKAFMTAETITVKDLTERTGKPAGEILKKLLMLGIMATINNELDFDTASLVCSEFGIELEMKLEKTAEEVLTDALYEDKDEDLKDRPPVVTIMGHVDHGKTSLLDYIRRAHVTTTEAGGITQHIGAYSVSLKGQKITFLDTPGHEAFTAMRARGAQATDIAVLVVAADDGVMPQTVEAINHAKAAGVPIVVAINKMDKDTAMPERIKQDLTAHNLVAEEWGGDVIMAPVSAKTGEGVDHLLEMILLQAEVLQLKANPNRLAKGIIIEAKLDKNRGPLATVLLQSGTLHVGDNVVAGHAFGRVRALQNDRGERVQSAGPAMPVEIAGFTDVPDAGEEMFAVEDDKLTRQVAEERKEKLRSERILSSSKISLSNLYDNISEGKVENLNLIIKADVQGSTEAVRQALEKLSNDHVKIKVLHSGVGAINRDDVNLANAFNAIIIGFNIRPDAGARTAAEKDEVDIRLYRVIYQAIEDIEKAMKGMLEPVLKEILLGHAEVRDVFKITGAGTIAGSYVQDGKMQRNAKVRLLRDNVVIFEGKLSSLRRFKDDVREVAEGYECGISLDGYNDIKLGDIVECFTEEEIEN